ncbi:MAG TPA: NTF2-like N-terminal transpeptidase domain-containing protein, partial [Actinomycetota bacterium]|nr:NTF2-like N-terminal transpeptidase domain-containing protein [Actinomycetota bacterium]
MKRALASLVVVALLAPACTPEDEGPELPPAGAAFESFVDAWNERDASAMSELMTDPSGGLGRFFGEDLGDEVEFEVTPGDVATQTTTPEDASPTATSTAQYSIAYSVDGSEGEPLDGELEMRLQGGEWLVDWEEASMWPGFEDADGLRVVRKWPPRAPIRDRKGRVLATGPAPGRRYPFAATAGSTVGHIGSLTRKEAAEGDVYEEGDLAGASGMELAFDERLTGTPGLRLDVVDGKKRLETLARAAPDPGRPVRTTLDVRIQQAAAGAFGGTTGGAVVLDPANGDLLAVVSSAELNPA